MLTIEVLVTKYIFIAHCHQTLMLVFIYNISPSFFEKYIAPGALYSDLQYNQFCDICNHIHGHIQLCDKYFRSFYIKTLSSIMPFRAVLATRHYVVCKENLGYSLLFCIEILIITFYIETFDSIMPVLLPNTI